MRHLKGHLSCWPKFMEELIILVVILVILVSVKRK